MQNKECANQFLPYDALKGFRSIIKEKEKIVVNKKDLCPDSCDELNYKLMQIKPRMIVKVIYYHDYEYIEVEGMVAKIDLEYSKTIQIVDKVIKLLDIIEINSDSIID